jgi:hypothetical protein
LNYFIHVDHVGTPREIYNDQQQLVWRWSNQEPFGDSPPDENPSGLSVFEMPVAFLGTYRDRETNLLYNWHATSIRHVASIYRAIPSD